MISVAALPGFSLLALSASLLSLLMVALGFATGAARARAGVVINPEDAKGGVQVMVEEPADAARARRAQVNALENVPFFLILALLAVLAQVNPTGIRVAIAVFTLARLGHAAFYLKGLQPWRSLSHGVGLLCLLTVMGLLAARLFTL